MDYTKWTSNRLLRFIFIIIIAGAIIGYFIKNHTHRVSLQPSISLPAKKPEKTVERFLKKMVTDNQAHLYVVRQGDILATLFHRAGLPNTLWVDILRMPNAVKYLDHLQIGHPLKIVTTPSHQFVSLSYAIDVATTLKVVEQNNHYYSTVYQKPLTKALAFKSSTIHGSLYQAAESAGLPPDLQHELDTMFSNSGIARDIRPGDRLEVLYHEYFVGDKADKPGNIVAAEITNGKQHYRVVRYTAPDDITGYYKSNGQGTMPEFMRIPLHYVRIGSHFNYHRYDPILHEIRPHLGVDFDAPMGTPVKAIGNGVVVFCGQMRGYGNVLIVRYGNIYKSLYAHLEKFARYVKDDEHVKKGQVIGYVGMTGWTTGPHLHFAVFKNGVAVNPLTVRFPHESPIPEKYRHLFFDKEDKWFHEMKLYEHAKLASK